MSRTPLKWFFAAVWLVNGLFCKVLDLVPRHREIVGRILGEEHAAPLTTLIGIAEIGMAVWILSGIFAKTSAAAQIITVILMNVIEFFLAPDLLLFGKFNSLVALTYASLVAWSGFVAGHRKSSANSCHSPN